MGTKPDLDLDDPAANRWHLDRRIPLALIITICVQTTVAIWGASNLWTRVDTLERQIAVIVPQGQQLVRIDTMISNMKDDISELKRMVRKEQP